MSTQFIIVLQPIASVPVVLLGLEVPYYPHSATLVHLFDQGPSISALCGSSNIWPISHISSSHRAWNLHVSSLLFTDDERSVAVAEPIVGKRIQQESNEDSGTWKCESWGER